MRNPVDRICPTAMVLLAATPALSHVAAATETHWVEAGTHPVAHPPVVTPHHGVFNGQAIAYSAIGEGQVVTSRPQRSSARIVSFAYIMADGGLKSGPDIFLFKGHPVVPNVNSIAQLATGSAIIWYNGKAGPRGHSLVQLRASAHSFAKSDYLNALLRGGDLCEIEWRRIIRLGQVTGAAAPRRQGVRELLVRGGAKAMNDDMRALFG